MTESDETVGPGWSLASSLASFVPSVRTKGGADGWAAAELSSPLGRKTERDAPGRDEADAPGRDAADAADDPELRPDSLEQVELELDALELEDSRTDEVAAAAATATAAAAAAAAATPPPRAGGGAVLPTETQIARRVRGISVPRSVVREIKERKLVMAADTTEGVQMTLKEQGAIIDRLKKENFGLQIKCYYLEGMVENNYERDIMAENIELTKTMKEMSRLIGEQRARIADLQALLAQRDAKADVKAVSDKAVSDKAVSAEAASAEAASDKSVSDASSGSDVVSQLRSQIAHLKAENANLSQSQADLRTSLREENARKAEQLARQAEQLSTNNTERDRLLHELDEFRQTSSLPDGELTECTINELRNRIVELKLAHQDQQYQLRDALAQIESMEYEHEDAYSQLTFEYESELQRLNDIIADLSYQVDQLTTAKAAAERELDILDQEIDSVLRDRDEQLAEANKALSDREAELLGLIHNTDGDESRKHDRLLELQDTNRQMARLLEATQVANDKLTGQLREQISERNALLATLWSRTSTLLGSKWMQRSAITDVTPDSNFNLFSQNMIDCLATLESIMQKFISRCQNVERQLWKDYQAVEAALETRTKRIARLELKLKNGELDGSSLISELRGQLAQLREENSALQEQQRRKTTEPSILLSEERRWVLRLRELEHRLKLEEEGRTCDRQDAEARINNVTARAHALQKELERHRASTVT